MNTYFCEYKLFNDTGTRNTCMTLFGGMTNEDDSRELGNVKLLGRWSTVGEGRGFCICEAGSLNDVQKWLNNWVTMADINVIPCLDDNQQRTLILGREPEYTVNYNNIGGDPKDNEDLFFIKYKFNEDKIQDGFEAFSQMDESADKADSGDCTSYGRWHVPSQGCGYAVASSPSVMAVYKWAFNWVKLCNCEVIPVTNDKTTRDVIKSKPGFSERHSNIMKSLGLGQNACYVDATFEFKTDEFKKEFLKILDSKDGFEVTRKWSGCISVESFESEENPLEFTIRQKWEKSSDHDSYLQMRKDTGLFDKVTQMLVTPPKIVHLKHLPL